MKTSFIYPIAMMAILFTAQGSDANAQRQPRRYTTERLNQSESPKYNDKSATTRDHDYNSSDRGSDNQYNNNNESRHGYENNRHDNGNKHYHNDMSSNRWENNGHQKHNHYSEKSLVYYPALPNNHYKHYCHNGQDYYHCNNEFYRFQAGYGYVRVESPFFIVEAIPAYCSVRDFNGQRCHFYQGYYYLPVEGGWMMIPEAPTPQPHFSVSIQIGR